jgi:ribosomal protein S8
MNFKELKEKILERAKNANACSSEYTRALQSNSIEELIEVIKDNLFFIKDNEILNNEMIKDFEKPELFNSGNENTGLFNSGDLNSGDRNSGYQNSGDLNSGYRNSGILCNRKINDPIIIFNKESKMTWYDWYNSKASLLINLKITEWIEWDQMSDKFKKDNPEAFVTGGYLKVYEYKEAWANLWNSLSNMEKDIIISIPNFDIEIFEDITGINANQYKNQICLKF